MTDVTEQELMQGAGKKLADIMEERFDDDDGIWRLLDDDIEAIVEIADALIKDNPDEPEFTRDAILIETTCLVLQQRVLYRDKKGPGTR